MLLFTTILTLAALCGAVSEINPTPSPDSAFVAYTSEGDLYVRKVGGDTIRLTSDASSTVYNGYASWVYYEEVFGRASKYRAFWWSPDSRYLAFYRFDDTQVRMFPIYSPFGDVGGRVLQTRYPLCGEPNPQVSIGIADLSEGGQIRWADFDYSLDQYFGTPFWGADSKTLFVQREPRVQQDLELYAVSAGTGKKTLVYSEHYPAWLDWMQDMLFTSKGLYMVRSFETSWQQIYFLSYDGKTLKRLTDGENWRVSLIAVDEKRGDVYFTSYRESDIHPSLYRLDSRGRQKLISDPRFHTEVLSLDPDRHKARLRYQNLNTAPFEVEADLRKGNVLAAAESKDNPLRRIVRIPMSDSLLVPGIMLLPENFDSTRTYPVVMEIYGGPDTPYVRDINRIGSAPMDKWFSANGIIKLWADCRAAGHNGRKGLDLVWRDLTSVPVEDFCTWAKWLQALSYVDGDKIGVMGFSFGGTMTSMLVIRHPEYFRCGIAGGGVYDWVLYDSHYTERFMDTPQRNPEGYERSRVLSYAREYDPTRSRLKLTHGTSDDNVHFQNTLLLVDSLQRAGKQFDLMIYPGGMHGYRGEQSLHDNDSDKAFWMEYLMK